ncbi:MAG: hypothetical protein K2K21_01975 [Lachnospiraceae bacterium]|nr:hypothetical protein [Lachnospiraceae bacterium]
MKKYNNILYRQTSDWIIIEDKVYILQDNGEMKEDAEYSFFPIEEVNDWVKELEETEKWTILFLKKYGMMII